MAKTSHYVQLLSQIQCPPTKIFVATFCLLLTFGRNGNSTGTTIPTSLSLHGVALHQATPCIPNHCQEAFISDAHREIFRWPPFFLISRQNLSPNVTTPFCLCCAVSQQILQQIPILQQILRFVDFVDSDSRYEFVDRGSLLTGVLARYV